MELFGFDPPELSPAEVGAIADRLYGLHGDTQRLRGERSHNTRFVNADGMFVLRIGSAAERHETIEFHAAAMQHLARRDPALPIARMLASLDGDFVPAIELDGRHHRVRLETFLPGVTFDDGQTLTPHALTRIGEALGAIADALADFDDPAAHGFMPWDIANGLIHDPELIAGLGADARALVERAAPRLAAASEVMQRLPRQVIHNDGHAGNLLRHDRGSGELTGVIDFGDMVHTVRVADIAVCGASFAPHQADPIEAIAALTLGYHRRATLSVEERAAVADAVLARLTLSTLMVDYQIVHAPHIAEAVTAERAGTLAGLARWLDLDPDRTTECILHTTTDGDTP